MLVAARCTFPHICSSVMRVTLTILLLNVTLLVCLVYTPNRHQIFFQISFPRDVFHPRWAFFRRCRLLTPFTCFFLVCLALPILVPLAGLVSSTPPHPRSCGRPHLGVSSVRGALLAVTFLVACLPFRPPRTSLYCLSLPLYLLIRDFF